MWSCCKYSGTFSRGRCIVIDVEWWMCSGRSGVAVNIEIHLVVVDVQW